MTTTMNDDIREAWRDGFYAGRDGRLRSDSPDGTGVVNGLAWHDGWNIAVRAHTLQSWIGSWAAKTFRDDQRSLPIICHLTKEVQELRETAQLMDSDPKRGPSLRAEAGDCLILLCDLAHREGFDLVTAAVEKMAVNERRRWKAPDAEGVCEHVREDADA